MFEKADDPNAPDSQEPLIIPPPRTLKILLANGEETEAEGHVVQTPDSGGLNILRMVQVSETQAFQHLELMLAPGEWKRVVEVMRVPDRLSLVTLH
jgi:hypothetical protein